MKKILLLLIIYFSISIAYGQTNISGIISTNTTWTPEGNPYIISGNTLVNQGITLNIEPSVVIRFSGNYYLYIDGKLDAQGNNMNPIIFTSNNPSPQIGDWIGIKFRHVSISNANILNYCQLEYAQKAIVNDGSTLTVTNCLIQNNQTGINSAQNQGGSTNILNNIITHNTISGISGWNDNFAPAGNSIIGNQITYNGNGIDSTLDVRKINNNIISHNTNGIFWESGSNSFLYEINGNTISDNINDGVYMRAYPIFIGSFQYNTISNNGGVGIRFIDPNLTIQNNIIVNNNIGVWPTKVYSANIEVHQNCIYQNNLNYKQGLSSDTNASNNWWGTNDLGIIGSSIFDFYDDFNLGKIMISPILNVETSFCITGLATNVIRSNNSIAFFPNPFSSETTLKTDNVFHNATLLIYNSIGRTIKKIKNISGQTFTLFRDNLSSGLYFVQIKEGDKIYSGKLLIVDK